MTVYTVHAQGQDVQDAAFVPEGFSWGAFVFAPLWLVWHRLWLAALLWCAAMGILFALPFGLSFFAKEFAAFLIALLCGLEGRQWVRHKLMRQGKPVTDIVSGDTRDDAEIHFFHRWQDSVASPPIVPPLPLRPAHAAATETPFGLFPEPESRP
jgi:Protein of unknown function (DUF2628)